MADLHDESFDEQELAAAMALDAQIDAALAGGPARDGDATVTWLTAALRSDPPPTLGDRVRREHAQREHSRWWPVQVAAAAMAALLIANGAGSLVNGAWVADNLGEHYSPHAFAEAGLALIAAGIAVAAGVLRRAWLPVSVAAGVPLGVVLGIRGIPESQEFAAGAVLHLGQGAVAIVLGALWWRSRRYSRQPPDEGGA